MEKIFEKLSQKIITLEDLILLLEEINLIKKTIYNNANIPLSEKLKGKIREGLRKEIEKLEKESVFPSSPKEQTSFFEEFKNFLFKIPNVKLEIAFEPSKIFVSKIENWFKQNIKKRVILNIVVSPKIVGGAKIEYQGRWKNYSLEKKLKKLYEGV